MTVIHDSAPNQAVLGRQPSILPPLEAVCTGECADTRSNARVRKVAAANILEATAQQRLERANRHKSRPSLERFQYKPQDLVDIWFEPTNKDSRGWRGPATVLSVQPDEGNITVRVQGRTIDRTTAEVREHISYLAMGAHFTTPHFTHLG